MAAVLLLAPFLSLDNFSVAMVFAIDRRSHWLTVKVVSVFAAGAGISALTGLILGHALAAAISVQGAYLAGAVLLTLGMYEGLIAPFGGPDLSAVASRAPALLVITVSVSLDTLAGGFAFGVNGKSIAGTVVILTLATGAMTFCGLALSTKLHQRLANRGNIVVGFAMVVVGVGMFAHPI